ncbi:putative Ig domain-containing protein [Pedobacter frigoris]|uniref:Ig-like domain-containing protein n=1 Tax=Pedobacter frigoris TaxID=2571272 RepID=UPI00292D450E|nr:putative Ig domain-containing protein [Pedobacter frigoris]
MKWTSTLPGNFKRSVAILIYLLAITLIGSKSYAQSRIYATEEVHTGPYTGLGCGLLGLGACNITTVNNPGNALTSDNSATRIISNAGLALGLASFQGELELKFPSTVAAGKTSYIRINVANPDLLNTLLGGNLGNVLTNVVGSVVLGNRYFEAGARMGTGSVNNVTFGNSSNPFSTENIKLIKDANGYYYIAITPTAAYDRVYIKDFTNAVLGLGANSYTDVYYAFHGDGTNPCVQAFATSYEGTGLTADLLGLGKAGVTDIERAIDADPDNYSQISLGALGVAGTISQNVYFETLSNAGDEFNVKIQVAPALLNAGLLNNVTLTAYNGATEVYTGNLSTLLDLDLLGLLNTGQPAAVPFAPGVPFDRVKVTLSSLLNISLTQTFNLYSINRSAARPTFIAPASNIVNICSGSRADLTATTSALNELRWYEAATGGPALATTPSTGTYTTPALTANKTYYVSARTIGCTEESLRVPVNIIVTPIPLPPAVSTVAQICSGSTAVLSINSPTPGNTYRWYTDATGGTLLATGNSYTTSALTGTTTFYAETVTGTCVSPSRTAVVVTVNELPNIPIVTTANETISAGQTATLAATADAGNTIKWYALPAGGAALASGNTFTTPILNTTTTYYVGTENASGCSSATRVPVTVTVTNGPANPNCNAAISQQSGIEGICLACSILDAGNSTDADLNNFTRINLAVGVGAVGYQRLLFASQGSTTDSIRLDLETPTGLADVGVLGGITVRVMNGTNVVVTYPLNSSLLNLKLLSGNRFKVTLPAGGVYDRVEVRFGALVSALSSLNIYGAEIIYPNPTVASTGLFACSGSTTTLNASANGGTILKWYAASNGGVALATGETFTTGALSATTTYYIEVSKGTCANSQRVPVTVTVNPPITFATTTLSNATVASSYSSQINSATGGTPGFTYALSPGSSLPAGLTLSSSGIIGGTPSTAINNATFSIVATDSKGCSSITAFALNVTPALALPAAVLPNGIVGTVYPTQTIPAATGGTTPYTYTASNLPPGLTFNVITREITGTPTQVGTYTIPVTATDANGNTVSRDYTIIVRDPLVLPTATLADGTVGETYLTQTIPSATGGNGPYVYSATTGLPPGLTFDPLTRQITGTPTQVGTFTIPVKVTDADGSTITTNYTIKVSDPLLLAGKVLPDGTVGTVYVTQNIPAATGGTGPYTYVASNLPPGLSFNTTTRDITGTPTQSGNFNVSVKVTDAVGANVTQNYSINVNGVLSLPTAVLPDGLVGTSYPTQTLPAVSGGTAPYTYTATGLPAGLNFDPATRQITGIPTVGGNYNITLKATDNTGLSTTTDYSLLVNVGAPVVAAATTCSGTTATLSVSNMISGVVYKWYGASGNTVLFTGTTYTTDVLTSNTTYYVEASSGSAVSSRTQVMVSINAAPASATIVTNNETISSGQTATLQAIADAGNTIRWYANPTGGVALGTGTSFITPALSSTTTYYVETQNASGCFSLSRVPVTVTVTSTPVNPNCNAAVGQQSGIGGLCLLCSVQTPGGSTDSDPNTFTKINLAVGVGSTGYQRLIFASAGAATDSIRLDLATPVGLADVGVLGGVTVTVMNGSNIVATYPLNSTLLDLKLLSGNRFKATLPAGGIYDRVEISFGALVSALSNLSIYGAEVIYPNPTLASTGQAICSGSTTILTATANGGTTLKWYSSPTSTTVLATGGTFTTGTLTSTTTYYIEVSKGTCANVQRVPVTVTVTATPSNPVVAAVAPVCSGSTATLNINSPVTGVIYNWYTDPTAGTIVGTGTSYTTGVLTADATYYVEAAAGSCVSAARTAVTVTVNPLPTPVVITSNNETISSGQTATLSATPIVGATINWYAAPTGGAILASGVSFTTPALTATTTYYAGSVNASGCASAIRTPVTVVVIGGPVNPNCNAATSQQSGVNGICLLCTVQDAGNSVDDNLTNYTTISLPVGVGGSGYQRLIFAGTGAGTDSIRLNLETPTGLADVGVLGGIQVRIMNGSIVVNTYTLSSSLLNLRLLSGNRFIATLPAGGTYDRVEVRATGLVSALINLRIYGAEIIYPNPTVSASGQLICSGSATTLSAAANGGTTLRWYADATGGAPLATGENFTTPILTANTTYYVEVSKGSCSNQIRVPVNVVVTTAPAAPVVATVAPVCSGSSTPISISNPIPGTTYNWYADQTSVTPIFSGTIYTTPVLTANTTYYVEAANGTCISATRTAVSVTVNPLPVLPQVQASATTVNAGQTVILTASSTDANVTFNWYTSATSTIPVYSGSTYVTPPLMTTTTYYLSVNSTITGCSSASRVQVTINVNGGGSPNPVPCEAPTTQVNGINGLAVLAGVFNPQLAIDNDTKTASSLVMPVGLLGASVYQRVGFANPSNVGDTVRVLLTAPGKLLSLGLLSEIRIGTYNNNVSNNDGLAINNPLIRLELLSGNTEALISFVPTQVFNQVEVSINDGLAGLLKTVDLNYVQRVAVAPKVVSANVTACETQTALLSVQSPNAGITYKWYDATGNYLADGTTFTTPALTTNTRFFVEANTASGCASYRTVVNVTVTPKPQPPVLVSPTVNACTGTDVILSVSNPLVGITYKWYDNNGIYQADGTTFTITGITGTVSYLVEAVNSCSVASSRTTATINVGIIDKPVVTPASVTIRSGSPAVLTATSSTVGATFRWYDSPVSTTVLSTDARYETASLVNNGTSPLTITYYVEAFVSGGCTSVRTSVDVIVIPNGVPTDVPCEAAVNQVRSGVDGIALLTGVFNPQLAVDNDVESASSLVMPVGALGASVYQHVGFTGLSKIGDTVKVRISSPGKLLSLAVLPSIELTTYNGSTSNNDVVVANNPLIHLELFSDNSGAILSFVPQKEFDGVELRLRSGLAAVLTTVDFNYAQRVIAHPTVESTSAIVCAGSSATLAVKNPASTGITYKWYRGTTYLADGATISTDPALAAGTYDYFVSANRNGCESVKTKVIVTILSAPDAPEANANPLTTCPNTPVTLSVKAVAGVSFNWYTAAVGGNLLAANTNTYTTPASLGVGVHDFYVGAVNGNSCGNTTGRTKITLTVNPTAVATDVTVTGAGAPFCSGTKATLKATSTTVTSPVFTWYTDPSLTNAVFTGDTFITDALTGTITYYVTVRGTNKCANAAAEAKVVTLIVNPPATAADLDVTGAGSPICSGTTAILTATTTTITNPVFTWYTDAALTNAVFTGDKFTTPMLTTSRTYYVTVKGDNKCENLASNAEVVVITVNPPASASDIIVDGANTPFCAGNTASLVASTTTVTNPVFTWYSDANLTVVVSNSASFTTPPLTATTTYYVTVRGLNKCENTAATAKIVTVTVNPPALASDINVVGAGAPLCAGASATLTASSVTVVSPVFTWYSDAALTNAVWTGPTFNTGALSATTTYYVTVSGSNRCANTAANAKVVKVTINPPALASDISVTGAGTPLCAGTTATLTATSTTVTNPIFTWYSDPALTTAVWTGSVFNTPSITTTTNYYVTVRGANKCENTAANARVVTLTVNPPALASDINVTGADNPLCSGTSASLVASSTTVTNPVFTWYTDAALTNPVWTGATFNTPVLTATKTYYVTVRGANKCANTAANAKVVTITINPPALASDINVAGAGSPLCAGTTATLTASSTTVTNPVFTWYSDANLTVVVSNSASFTTPPLTATTTYYVTVRGLNKCENTAATAKIVTVTVNPPALASDINVVGAGAPLCAGASATLTASSVTVVSPVFTWYSDAALTNAVWTGPTFNTGALSATTTYYVTVSGSNRCANTAANAKVVKVTINPPALASDISVTGAGTPLCAGTTATLTATSTTVTNPIFTWYSDPALTTAVWTGSVFNTPSITTTTNYYVTVRGANKCENTAANARVVTLTVNPPALASDVSVSGANPLCEGGTASLTASSTTVTNPVFTWYTDAALTNAVSTGPTYSTPVLSATTTYYVTVRGANKCANTAGTARVVTITVNPLPITPVIASAGTSICSGESTVLTVQNAQTGVSYMWYDVANGGTSIFTGTQFTTGILNANTDFYVVAISATGCGNATGRVKTTVTVSPKPLVPTVASSSVNVCAGSAAVLTVSNPQTGVIYKWYSTAVNGTELASGTSFTTPGITVATIYYVGASTATCISTSRTAVTVTPTAIPLPPASLSGVSGPLCSGSSTVLTVDNSDATLSYRWYNTATGGTALSTGTSFTTPGLTATTTYYVEASNTLTSCTSATRTPVVVTVLSKLDAPVVSVQSATSTSITFQWNVVAGATGYEVSLDNGLTWIPPTSGTTYLAAGLQPDQSVTIRVRAKGQLDCQLSDATSLTAKSENPLGNTVFVPNTFTPNNDGKNDIFLVYGNTIAKMKLRVYNQWGQFIYESLSIQNGWDGTYKGDIQPNGVYVYYLDVEFNDGTKTTKKGTITLLR